MPVKFVWMFASFARCSCYATLGPLAPKRVPSQCTGHSRVATSPSTVRRNDYVTTVGHFSEDALGDSLFKFVGGTFALHCMALGGLHPSDQELGRAQLMDSIPRRRHTVTGTYYN